jgi:uncharacterized membrane protein YcgQ (UPF0703/DUF1980 family)
MRSLFIVLAVLVGFSGCVKKNKVPVVQSAANSAMHEVKVVEVIQTSQYTYLKVSENGAESWIAVTSQEAAAGETYYYEQALEMKNFQSKELKRTFETIYFVQGLSKQPAVSAAPSMANAASHKGKAAEVKKEGISVAPADGGITIAQLYKDKENYAGKKVKVKGKVVKINEQVMGKNWIHIQDGTGDADSFDLTVTTLDGMKMDDVVTFEGTISLKKDFGYGYFYEVIMEDAALLK